MSSPVADHALVADAGTRGSIQLMQAHRALLETDENGRLSSVPPLPPHAKVEAIFLVLEPGQTAGRRTPPPELAGLRIAGDIVAPAIALEDWKLDG
jgi:hypothetical protein